MTLQIRLPAVYLAILPALLAHDGLAAETVGEDSTHPFAQPVDNAIAGDTGAGDAIAARDTVARSSGASDTRSGPVSSAPAAENLLSAAGRVTWNPATDDAISQVACSQVPEWMAQPREWITRRGDWCSVEVHFEYPGSGGDIDLVVSRQSASGRQATHYASVDLPGNGGAASEFQFIFPCPEVARERLCLSYASTTDADALSYDFLDLGVDAQPAKEAVVEGASNATFRADAADRGSASSILRQDIAEQLGSVDAAVFAAPAPAPIDRLRKRPR